MIVKPARKQARNNIEREESPPLPKRNDSSLLLHNPYIDRYFSTRKERGNLT
jgi:hypothetical protein